MRSLHVPRVTAHVSSRCSTFLPHPEDKRVGGLIGHDTLRCGEFKWDECQWVLDGRQEFCGISTCFHSKWLHNTSTLTCMQCKTIERAVRCSWCRKPQWAGSGPPVVLESRSTLGTAQRVAGSSSADWYFSPPQGGHTCNTQQSWWSQKLSHSLKH